MKKKGIESVVGGFNGGFSVSENPEILGRYFNAIELYKALGIIDFWVPYPPPYPQGLMYVYFVHQEGGLNDHQKTLVAMVTLYLLTRDYGLDVKEHFVDETLLKRCCRIEGLGDPYIFDQIQNYLNEIETSLKLEEEDKEMIFELVHLLVVELENLAIKEINETIVSLEKMSKLYAPGKWYQRLFFSNQERLKKLELAEINKSLEQMKEKKQDLLNLQSRRKDDGKPNPDLFLARYQWAEQLIIF